MCEGKCLALLGPPVRLCRRAEPHRTDSGLERLKRSHWPGPPCAALVCWCVLAWSNLTLAAATLRTAQQHDEVRGRRRRSVAHRPQPNERSWTGRHHHARLHVVQHAAHAHCTCTRHSRISFPRPVPRLLSQEGALRFDTSVGGGRTTTFWALRKVRSSRDSSNSAPNRPSSGSPGTRSQHPPGLTAALTRLESGAKGSG